MTLGPGTNEKEKIKKNNQKKTNTNEKNKKIKNRQLFTFLSAARKSESWDLNTDKQDIKKKNKNLPQKAIKIGGEKEKNLLLTPRRRTDGS